MARFSILFLSYNDSPFIIDSLKELHRSDLRNVELIFSDDSSSDASVVLRNEFLKANKFDRSVDIQFADNKRNVGGLYLGKRFNEVLDKVGTEFVIMQSADDIPNIKRFENLFSAWSDLDKKKVVIHSSFKTIDETGVELGITSKSPTYGLAKTIWLGGSGVLGATIGMHIDIARRFESMCEVVRFEDSIFTTRGKLLDGIYFIDSVLLSYRRHSSNISGYNYFSQESFQHFVRGKIGVYETIRRDLLTCEISRFYILIVDLRLLIFSFWQRVSFDLKMVQILFLLFGPNGLSITSRLKRFYNYGR